MQAPLVLRLQLEQEYRRRHGRPSAKASRNPADRAKYSGDPWSYISDILGLDLSEQQEEALELIERETRVLLPSGNNLGKTFLLGAYAVYFMDAVGAQLGDNGKEQGARVLLPGPDHATVYATVYSEMLTHIQAAEDRGHRMPGKPSPDSVTWRAGPRWQVEAFSPPKQVRTKVAHTASGRHHRNQIALIEEGQGVEERVWKATEGMCSSAGNKIISSFNPTEPSGPAFIRGRQGNYKVMHLDAFEFVNVRRREMVVVGALDFRVV